MSFEIKKYKQLLTGLTIGLLTGWIASRFISADRYSIQVIGESSRIRAIRTDNQTGQTWQMDVQGRWTNSVFPN